MQRCIVTSLTIMTLIVLNNGAVCTPCTPNIVPGVIVNLTDSVTALPISGATLSLISSTGTEIMQESAAGQYSGADENPGTYSLNVQADGYEDASQSNIVVTADICHVITVNLDIQMNPN